ncbi:MAG: DUF3794 domain-containing protein [Lachnospiraceae bacterium]|nr:DUF3794 domain-containing protein [Lachnospiraceae bacterium]
MDLIKSQIQMEKRKGTVSAQSTFDEVYNLPDSLPDIHSVITDGGEVRLDEVKTGTGHVTVRGAVRFHVLYKTDQNEWKIAGLEGEIPFQETLSAPDMSEFDMTAADAALEDLSIRVSNSRKLNIRALLELRAVIRERYDADIPIGIEAELQPEMRMEEQEFLELKYYGKESCTIREEIYVPANKPNVQKILWQQAQVFGNQGRLSPGILTVQGEIQILIVYAGEENGSLQWFTAKVPYRCEFEIPEAESSMIPWLAVRIQNLSCSPGSDEDGEPRLILAEGGLHADVRLYEEEKKTLVADTYALDRNLVLKKEKTAFPELRMKNESKCRVDDTIRIQNQDSGILQICAGFGMEEVDRKTVTGDGILAEGAVRVQLLYLTDHDNTPLEAAEGVIPFQYLIEIPGIQPEDDVELQHSLDDLSFLMKNSGEVEIQAVVCLQVMATGSRELEVIGEIQEQEFKIEELNTQPSIVGLTLGPEDSLWEIAKKYHTTAGQIRQINRLESDRISGGMKILLIKQLPKRCVPKDN